MVCRMTRSKVKVTRPLKLEILQFSKSISSSIFNVSWQMTTDSETTEQYLNFARTRFLISVPVFVSHDYEPQSRTGLIFEIFIPVNFKSVKLEYSRIIIVYFLHLQLFWHFFVWCDREDKYKKLNSVYFVWSLNTCFIYRMFHRSTMLMCRWHSVLRRFIGRHLWKDYGPQKFSGFPWWDWNLAQCKVIDMCLSCRPVSTSGFLCEIQ